MPKKLPRTPLGWTAFVLTAVLCFWLGHLFNGTTVEATYIPSFLKSAPQAFQASWRVDSGGGAASTTNTITSVDTNYATVQFLGCTNTASVAINPGPVRYPTSYKAKMVVTTATTITTSVNATDTVYGAPVTNTCNGVVVEYLPVLLKQAVQRGTISLAAAASNTATITAVGSKAFLVPCGYDINISISTGPNTWDPKIELTNSNTVTFTTGAATTGTGCFQVVDPK